MLQLCHSEHSRRTPAVISHPKHLCPNKDNSLTYRRSARVCVQPVPLFTRSLGLRLKPKYGNMTRIITWPQFRTPHSHTHADMDVFRCEAQTHYVNLSLGNTSTQAHYTIISRYHTSPCMLVCLTIVCTNVAWMWFFMNGFTNMKYLDGVCVKKQN